MTPGKIVLGFSAMLALLIVFAVQRVPGDERIVVEKPKIGAGADDIAALPKSDREPIRVINLSTEPKVTERITPLAPDAPVSVPPVILVQDDDDKPPASRHRRQRAKNDVCTRHHLHKVTTNRGRSWHCK